MKIYILDKILEYKNEKKYIDNIFEDVDNILSDEKYALSHLEVDGKHIYEDFYDYFNENIYDIKEVKVFTKTPRELAKDLIVYIIETMEEYVPKIQVLANEFYNDATEGTWTKLVDLFEKIKWILDATETLDADNELKYIVNDYELWNLYIKDTYELREIMVDFQDILASDDLNFVPEILYGEIVPLFEDMKEKLEFLVNRELDMSLLN